MRSLPVSTEAVCSVAVRSPCNPIIGSDKGTGFENSMSRNVSLCVQPLDSDVATSCIMRHTILEAFLTPYFLRVSQSGTHFNGYPIEYKGFISFQPGPYSTFILKAMEAHRRVFPFDGSDLEYIQYLESMLLNSQSLLNPSRSNAHQPSPRPRSGHQNFINLSGRSFANSRNKKNPSKSPTVLVQWERDLKKFLSSISRAGKWDDAREAAGFATIDKNKLAIQLLLGRPTSSFSNLELYDGEAKPLQPLDDAEMIMRGCHYGRFVARCEDDGKFTVRIAKYQQLVFVCYCTVLLFVGNSKDTINWMMRQFISDSDDKNLEKYRSGCLWVNKCIVELLKHRWGHKSWEIFILCALRVTTAKLRMLLTSC